MSAFESGGGRKEGLAESTARVLARLQEMLTLSVSKERKNVSGLFDESFTWTPASPKDDAK